MLLKIPVVTRLVWNIYVSFHNSWGPQKATEKVQLNRDWLLAKTVEKQRKLGYVSYARTHGLTLRSTPQENAQRVPSIVQSFESGIIYTVCFKIVK